MHGKLELPGPPQCVGGCLEAKVGGVFGGLSHLSCSLLIMISESTMQLADHKHKLWREQQATLPQQQRLATKQPTEQPKCYASADFERHWTAQLSSVQHSMRTGDTYSAYKCLNPLSNPKHNAGRTLRDRPGQRQGTAVS